MTDRFAYLTKQLLKPTSIEDQIEVFGRYHIVLPNPATGYITAIGGEGEQIEVTFDWLRSRIIAWETVSWQWWLDDSTDIYCRYRFIGDRLVEEYGLDGLGESIEKVDLALVEWFLVSIRQQAGIGIVIDNDGVTEDFDWETFFLGRGKYVGDLPTLLGLRSKDAFRVTSTSGEKPSLSTDWLTFFTQVRQIRDVLTTNR